MIITPPPPPPPIIYYDGLAAHIILQSAICSKDLNDGTEKDFIQCHICSILSNRCSILRKRFYLLHKCDVNEIKSKKCTSMKMIGYVLGQICSLNCKHCCEKLPYFPSFKKTQVPANEVIKDINKVVGACEFITILEFVGGEPFLHKELPEILRHSLKIKNVGFINVFTNGTVLPSIELCELLGDQRITIHISNYTKSLSSGHKIKVEATENILNKYKAHFFYADKNWFDFTKFDFTNYEKNELQKRYGSCILSGCHRLHKGILYHCSHHYAGDVLGKIPSNNDSVKINLHDTETLALKLEEFCKTNSIEACKYCALPFNAPVVAPGIQV